ncbi:linker for activation of T-cells family member 2 isoform X2 [Pleurodeles waltl]|uniref:linker for activation of T-cells family member 2 isoform X2 n=1 Tax=Pleurodeles waltl TaxID=8319 RepID=UPI003709C5B4
MARPHYLPLFFWWASDREQRLRCETDSFPALAEGSVQSKNGCGCASGADRKPRSSCRACKVLAAASVSVCLAVAWRQRRRAWHGTDGPMESAARIKGDVEPLWAIFSIFLLGALVTLCTKCRNSGELKEDGTFRKTRSLNTNEPGFQIVRSYTYFKEEPRYQNASRVAEISHEEAYLEPLVSDYYNCGAFLKPPAGAITGGEEDGNSYVNVLIPPMESSESETDDTQDYANTAQLKNQPRKNSGSSENDYTDPDYVNATLPRSTKTSDSK